MHSLVPHCPQELSRLIYGDQVEKPDIMASMAFDHPLIYCGREGLQTLLGSSEAFQGIK